MRGRLVAESGVVLGLGLGLALACAPHRARLPVASVATLPPVAYLDGEPDWEPFTQRADTIIVRLVIFGALPARTAIGLVGDTIRVRLQFSALRSIPRYGRKAGNYALTLAGVPQGRHVLRVLEAVDQPGRSSRDSVLLTRVVHMP